MKPADFVGRDAVLLVDIRGERHQLPMRIAAVINHNNDLDVGNTKMPGVREVEFILFSDGTITPPPPADPTPLVNELLAVARNIGEYPQNAMFDLLHKAAWQIRHLDRIIVHDLSHEDDRAARAFESGQRTERETILAAIKAYWDRLDLNKTDALRRGDESSKIYYRDRQDAIEALLLQLGEEAHD